MNSLHSTSLGKPGAQNPFLSVMPAGSRERRLALVVVTLSCLIFAAVAPFAQRPLPQVPAFLPVYQSALVVCDLITAVLMFGQFGILRSRALLVLAGAYLFSAMMAIAHALSFPGLFAPGGLLGAGPQSTAWIYFLWHGTFPLLVIAYSALAGKEHDAAVEPGRVAPAVLGAVAAAFVAAGGLTLAATAGHDMLPGIMQGDRDSGAKVYVATASWMLALVAIPVLWRRRPLTVLDLWLTVVMCVWVFDIALAAVLNAGRYDVGWYAGRIYGLVAGSFVLVMLLLETGRLYADLAQAHEVESKRTQAALAHHAERLRILHGIDRAIAVGEPPEAIMEAVVRPLRALLDVRCVMIGVCDREAGEVRWLAAAGGSLPPTGSGLRYPMRFLGDVEVLRRGEPQLVDWRDLPQSPEMDGLPEAGRRRHLTVPMVAGGDLIGALSLMGETSVFPPEQVQIAQEVAVQIAIAIAQTRLVERITRQGIFLRQVIDLDRNFIFAKDREGRFKLVNQAVAEAYGTTVENLLGRSDHDFNPNAEEVERFRRDDVQVMDSLEEKFIPEERITDASGRVRWLQTVKRPIEGAQGRADMILGVATDITERKQAEAKIRGQLDHLKLLDHITRAIGERQDLASIFQVVVRSLEDSLPIDFGCVCLYDPVANSLQMTCVGAKSEALAHELTMDEQAAIAIDANGLARCIQGHLVYEPDLGAVRFPFPERLARGGLGSLVMAPLKSESRVFGALVVARRAAQAFSSAECEFLRQLSEHVALAAQQAQLYGALQQAYDDLRQTQAAVMQEERLRALGQMASGIAHDINNALSPVSLYVESMLETERDLSERTRGYLQTIQRAVEDVAQTVARLREFYRQREQQLELAPVQVNDLAQQVVDLTRARWHDMPLSRGIVIRVVRELAPELPQVMGVESEIREALTNLVFNAVDAMPEGGTLTLRTRLADTGGQHPAVAVEVADSGAGMDEETRRRCLEPFFTTKGERGTGLGLAMVFGIVQRHSAEIAIDSAPGAGTTVRLMFAVAATVRADTAQPEAPAAPSRLRLLLIDDDPILLKSLRDALEADGHVIATASGGEAGTSAFRASLHDGKTFAAVITDLGMPYVDGRRVAAAIKEASPATPVILLTGWGQRMVGDNDIPAHVDRVLAKPPKLREVREALAQLCRAAAIEPPKALADPR